MSRLLSLSGRRAGSVACAATLVLFAASAVAPSSSAASLAGAHDADTPRGALVAHTILQGAKLGLSKPDDLTRIGGRLFVAFQNGVPSSGGTAGTPQQSTIVEFTVGGRVLHRWQLTGKCDGLTADPAHQRLIATVNEDGNSSLDTIPISGHGAILNYRYDANPLPHGGGTDSITFSHGHMYVAASAPAAGNVGPALYQVHLVGGVAKLSAAPFYDSSTASVANAGSRHGQSINLALTDPDSSTVVPAGSPRFAGDVMLDSQGDQQQVYAAHLGTDEQQLQVLKLSHAVDDTAWATARTGALVTSDSTDNTIVVVTGPFSPGGAYTSVTPAGANNAPAKPGPNYLGRINLNTGMVSSVPTTGDGLKPGGLIFLVPAGVATTTNNRSSAPTPRSGRTSLRPDRVLLRGACFQLLSPPRHCPERARYAPGDERSIAPFADQADWQRDGSRDGVGASVVDRRRRSGGRLS